MKNTHHTIAVLMDHFLGDYQIIVRDAVEFAAKEHDVNLVCFIGRAIDSPLEHEQVQNRIFNSIGPESISGVIVLGAPLSVYCGKERISMLCRQFSGLPICNIGLQIDGIPSIIPDNHSISDVVVHLIEAHQCREFAFIGGPPANEEAQIRRASFLDALCDYGIPFDSDLEIVGNFTVQSGVEAVANLLRKNKKFDALVAANDNMALGAFGILKKHGIRIPEDVCVTGFDDTPSARFHSPKLTTIRQPLEDLGRNAVEIVLRQIAGETVPPVVALNPTLIRRESCGCSHSRSDRFRSEHPPGLEGWQLDRALSEQKGALAERLLSSIPIPEEEFSHWAERLIDALFLEVQGAKGHFVGVLEEILRTAEWRLWLVDELQNAISLLRMYLRNTQWNNDINLEDIWHDARIILSDGAAHGQVKRRVDADLTSNLFLTRSAAVLPGSLTRAALIEAISKEFEAIGIENGAVFVFSKIASKKEESLECIVRIHNGLSWARPDETGYSVDTIVSSFVDAERRTSLVVIPLSSAAESVGVMILELGAPDLYYEMLREHMSSYLKSVSYYQDHVDKLLAEADEKRRELEMQHRQKLESLGVLAGGIAHDFNNMLSAMAGNLDIALLDLEEGLDCREPIMECKEVTNHASGLCKQLLAYSGKGDFVIKRMNLNQIIQDLSTLLKMSISKSVNLIFEFEHRLPDIEGDVDQINQVFLNLVVNASEAMEPSGGTITVRTYSEYRSMADFNESFFVGSQMEPGEYVIARVSDTGAGIEKDQLLQIFDPFFTTKFTGRGLGLAAVSGIVRGHRGGINVRSKKGSGTCFELLFPLIPRFSVVPKLTSVPPVWKGSGTILLVDDEPTVLRAGERLLKRMGFEVLLARDGQAAIDVFQKLGERISCVILDITMPGMGGVATMAELKKMRTAVPVILSSGYSEEQVIDSLDDAAPTAFLQKPYDFEKLARILQLALKTDSRPNSDGILI